MMSMNIFTKAFGRNRTAFLRKRENLNFGALPEYGIYYKQAIDDYNQQNLNSALLNINRTIENSDIDDWKHFAFKANVLEDLGNYAEAIKNYEKAIDFAGDDIHIYAQYHQLGFCYLNLGNDQKALEFYTYAIELKKQHPNTSFNEDLEGMDMGVLLGIEFKRMYNNRANALKNLNKLQEAIEDCKKALEYDLSYSNPYSMLSQIFSKAGQETKAVKFLKIAARLGNQYAVNTLKKLGYL
jgi:tetratricopeptide repeat protein, tpr, putative (fragment)